MKSILIGIDIGTSVIKSVAFDTSGHEVALSRIKNTACSFYSEKAECDMTELWQCVCQTLTNLTSELQNSDHYQIEAVSITGNMIGLWLLDRNCTPFCPAILWNDGRSVAILERWFKNGLSKKLFDISCTVMNPGFTVPLMCWMKEQKPELFSHAAHILFCKDWIRYCLTGELFTEETDASHIPGDLELHGISKEILGYCGLADYVDRFPVCLKSTSLAGYITQKAALETGLTEGTPVIAGLADVSASILGAGSLSEGSRTLILGTSCLCTLTSSKPVREPEQVGLSFLLPESRYIRAFPNQTGMMALNWFLDNIFYAGEHVSPEELQTAEIIMENEIPVGCHGLFFHPYLSSTGLVAPQYQPRVRGQFTGLSLSHDRYHMLKAVYEGIALAAGDCFSSLPHGQEPVTFVGGGTQNSVLSQMICDVTGLPLQKLKNQEVGALGAAITAGVGSGVYHDLESAVHTCRHPSQCLVPDMEKHIKYQPVLRRYQRLRESIVAECLREENQYE